MKISDAFPSKYLKSDDLGNQRITLTVMALVMEDIGDKEFKPVLRFIGKDKGMVLNKTNATILASTWGDETDAWQGRQLELFAQPVMFQGRQVMGLAVAPLLQPGQTAQQAGGQPQAWNTPQQAPHSPSGQVLQELADDSAGAEQKANQLTDIADDIPF